MEDVELLYCLPSFSAAPPWQEEASCLSSVVSLEWVEGWSSGQAVEAEAEVMRLLQREN